MGHRRGPRPGGEQVETAVRDGGRLRAAFFAPIVSALIRHLVDTGADWLDVPSTRWDTVVKAVPQLGDHRGPLTPRSVGAGPPRPSHHDPRPVLPDPRTRDALRHPRTAQEGPRGPWHRSPRASMDPARCDRLPLTPGMPSPEPPGQGGASGGDATPGAIRSKRAATGCRGASRPPLLGWVHGARRGTASGSGAHGVRRTGSVVGRTDPGGRFRDPEQQ